MQLLSDNWLTEGLNDFEYKKYLLLAYDRDLTKLLEEKKLYPHFDDIMDKLRIVDEFLHKIKYLEESKKEIDFFDIVNKRIVYHSTIKDNSMDTIKEVAKLSKDMFVDLYIKYRDFLDVVEKNILISGCKVEVFSSYEGYIKLMYGKKEKILTYSIYRLIYPYPHFIVKTGKANLKEYYNDRLMKNIFDVRFVEMFPLKETMIPVFRNKFLQTAIGYLNQ